MGGIVGDPSQLQKAEMEMVESVQYAINELRKPFDPNNNLQRLSRRYHAMMLERSMRSVENPIPSGPLSVSFATWDHDYGRILGAEACYRIGMRVCQEMNFTIEDAKRIFNTTPAPIVMLSSDL